MANNIQLLRLLLENEQDKSQESETNRGLSDTLSSLKSGLSDLKGIELEEPKKESLLNESITGLVASGLLAAPKLIQWLGKGIGLLAKKFTKKDDSTAAKQIEKFGKKWENSYISLLETAIKLTGFLKSNWKTENGQIDKDKLRLIAKVLYAIILGLALASAVKGVINPGSIVMKSIEAVLGTVKATEIAGIIKLLLPKFGMSVAA